MSIIKDIIHKHINDYKLDKVGRWDKPTPPPEPEIDWQDVYIIGRAIGDELEGMLSDKQIRQRLGREE